MDLEQKMHYFLFAPHLHPPKNFLDAGLSTWWRMFFFFLLWLRLAECF